MRVSRRATCALVLVMVLPAAAAAKGPRAGEAVWTAPDIGTYDVRSIAFLPVAMYDPNLENRQLVEAAFGQALKGTGYRFVSTVVARAGLARAGGDSLLRALQGQLLKDGRVDSLSAPSLRRAARARALLTVRVARMERMQLEPDQSGKPTPTVELHAALVDSTGRLLWTAHGANTMDGQYQDPANGSMGVQANGLSNQMVTGRLGAPSFTEVLTTLLAGWAPKFPARPPTAVAN